MSKLWMTYIRQVAKSNRHILWKFEKLPWIKLGIKMFHKLKHDGLSSKMIRSRLRILIHTTSRIKTYIFFLQKWKSKWNFQLVQHEWGSGECGTIIQYCWPNVGKERHNQPYHLLFYFHFSISIPMGEGSPLRVFMAVSSSIIFYFLKIIIIYYYFIFFKKGYRN